MAAGKEVRVPDWTIEDPSVARFAVGDAARRASDIRRIGVSRPPGGSADLGAVYYQLE